MLFFFTNKSAAVKLLDKLEVSINCNSNQNINLYKVQSANRYITHIRDIVENFTNDSARYIKCSEDEIEREFSEFIAPVIAHNHVVILALLGKKVNYRCRDTIEQVTKDSVQTVVLPTDNNDDAIRICVLFPNQSFLDIGEKIDDSAIHLLQYDN